MADTLHHPPFPPLAWELYSWVGEVTLPSWAGFQARPGKGTPPADGKARLSVSPADGDARTPPTAGQVLAFRQLLDDEAAIAEAVAWALIEYCPGDAYDGDDEGLLNASEPDDLRPLVCLIGVHVLTVSSDGAACIGFEFDCAWDEGHGAGVMTHRGRVIATGQGDCSFEAWIARDGLVR